jgi:DNA-directed RNA polymerase specialized sigma24 family protein
MNGLCPATQDAETHQRRRPGAKRFDQERSFRRCKSHLGVLVPCFQKARSEEFEAVALPHVNDLFRTARRLLCESSAAEDVVQDVYLQARRSFHRFERGTNCRAWLFTILLNAVHHYRRKWFGSVASEADGDLGEKLLYTPPVPETLMDEEVLTAFDRIPADFRALVLLADWRNSLQRGGGHSEDSCWHGHVAPKPGT